MKQYLFVYGSLGRGEPNEHILNTIGGIWEEAVVKGHLKEKGWGAKIGYPGIVLNDTGANIKGHVFISENLHHHWDELDKFEGKEYKRISTKVLRKSKKTCAAYIYVLNNHIIEK
ncbi:MAG: gamma-glutamylcyclotransferase [Calditrichaeota bacterium]|nr:MAG: gamma-glutamylcyclotransferase [Calditrichota bacterium]MBL1207253.1 gamma-glutamylcyclotransferase [Calditrichota bacterium]NOG47086.1 gamma-glutamylcyclotransferase [Calditrichota bacterium]